MNHSTADALRLICSVALFSLATLASAQNLTSACGTGDPNYKVNINKKPPAVTPPPAGKALVYFIHDGWDGVLLAYPTTVFGLDGQWVGADHGNSYFSVPVNPGEHHLCATLQTSIMSGRVELAHFTAEAGKTYYFRTRLILSRTVELLELEPINSDQGKYLSFVYPLVVSKPRK